MIICWIWLGETDPPSYTHDNNATSRSVVGCLAVPAGVFSNESSRSVSLFLDLNLPSRLFQRCCRSSILRIVAARRDADAARPTQVSGSSWMGSVGAVSLTAAGDETRQSTGTIPGVTAQSSLTGENKWVHHPPRIHVCADR